MSFLILCFVFQFSASLFTVEKWKIRRWPSIHYVRYRSCQKIQFSNVLLFSFPRYFSCDKPRKRTRTNNRASPSSQEHSSIFPFSVTNLISGRCQTNEFRSNYLSRILKSKTCSRDRIFLFHFPKRKNGRGQDFGLNRQRRSFRAQKFWHVRRRALAFAISFHLSSYTMTQEIKCGFTSKLGLIETFPFETHSERRSRAHAKVGQLSLFQRLSLKKRALSRPSVERVILKSPAGSPFRDQGLCLNYKKKTNEASFLNQIYLIKLIPTVPFWCPERPLVLTSHLGAWNTSGRVLMYQFLRNDMVAKTDRVI